VSILHARLHGDADAFIRETQMIGRFGRASYWGALAGVVLLATSSAHPQSSDDVGTLDKQIEQLFKTGKYAEATEVALRVIALQEKVLGPDHLEVAKAQDTLATLYRIQRRYVDAEQILKKSLMTQEKALGPDDLQLCRGLTGFAVLYDNQGRYVDAEPYLSRCLNVRERALGAGHPDVGQSLHELARLYRTQGRGADAEPLYDRAIALLGPHHPEAVLAAIHAGEFEKAARALNLGNRAGTTPDAAARAVRQTFFGQVTDLRWTSYRSIIGPTTGALTIEGEAVHGNGLWQPFSVQMLRDGGEWTMGTITLRGLAWK
jgi:tetratricopeptide (TPR) repeat protein